MTTKKALILNSSSVRGLVWVVYIFRLPLRGLEKSSTVLHFYIIAEFLDEVGAWWTNCPLSFI